MNFEILIQSLRNRDDQLCSAAADELERLNSKYDELGRAYDAMSADIVRLVDYILERESSVPCDVDACDVNEDGKIVVADVTSLVDIILNQ